MTSSAALGSQNRLKLLSTEQLENVIRQRMQVEEKSLRRLSSKLTLILKAKDAEMLSVTQISFLEELESLQNGLSRQNTIARTTSEVQIRSYRQELGDIEEQHETTRNRIEMLKRRLQEVKLERKNKLEYDTVAAEIVQLSNRSELSESMAKLTEQLKQVHAENAKYESMSKSAAERMLTIARTIDTLHADIGDEVGERERREVERGEGDADAEALEPAPSASRFPERREGDEMEQRLPSTPALSGSRTPRLAETSINALNPSATVFHPSSAPTSATAPATLREPRQKRDSAALNASDEEGEVQDTSDLKISANSSPIRNSKDDTPRKRPRTEE